MAEPNTELQSFHARFEALFNAGDLEGLVGLYEDDATMNAVRGKDAIREVLRGFLALGGKVTMRTTATFDGPDGLALAHAEWSLRGGSQELAGKSAEGAPAGGRVVAVHHR
jgi:ketosteroid isomerase-like protein